MICFISPPAPFLINDRVFPNLGILYLAALARSQGHQAMVYDCAGKWPRQWDRDIRGIKADYFGITATTPQYNIVARIAGIIKRHHPQTPVIFGGPHVSCGNEFDNNLFDIIVKGEGEKPLLEILGQKRRKGYYGMAQPQLHLDSLPVPARDLIDIRNYRYRLDGIPATSIMTSRGCPYDCAFCCQTDHRSRVRFFSSEYVIKEIQSIERLGFRALQFYDDIFILNKPRLFEICDYIKSRGIKFRCFVRANLAGEDIIERLKESGCTEVGFGAESGSDKVLKLVGKKTSAEMNRNVIKFCHKHGLRVKAFIIIGLPGETKETLKETENFLQESGPDDIDFTVLVVMKGSRIGDNPGRFGVRCDSVSAPYKSAPGQYEVHAWNKDLSAQDILNARNRLEAKFKKKELLR